jgi:hypothetical protein
LLCALELDQVPIYIGQLVDGVRSRVNRHLTSARSDAIANRQIDVWEVAWAGPIQCFALRLPRQAEHGSQIVSYFLELERSRRVSSGSRSTQQLRWLAVEVEGDSE